MSGAHEGQKCFLWSAIFGPSVHSADNMEPPLDALRPSWAPAHVLQLIRFVELPIIVFTYDLTHPAELP